jgi:hypothetical protein
VDRAAASPVPIADPAVNETSIAAAFEDWWIDSYGRPPATHARMTHVAFAKHLLELVELIKPLENTDAPV